MNTRFILILLSLSISGCTLLYSYSENLPQRLDQWTSKNKYSVALNTIDHIKPDHKDYRIIQKKKEIIVEKMNTYEQNTIKESSALANQGNWVKAFSLLNIATENIFDTKNIKKHHANLMRKRKTVILSYENEILYNQAKFLIKEMVLYEKIKITVSTNETNYLHITKYDNLREKTSLSLSELSEQQYKNNQFNSAINTINLALKLNPELDTVKKLKTTTKLIDKATKSIKAEKLKKAKSLLSKLSQGYSHSILSKAKSTIVSLEKNNNENKSNIKLISQLKKHLSKGIKQRFGAASNLYSKGKTQEALSIWIELKELDPDNAKLQSHIERAEKIMSKLKKLSNKPKK